MSISSNRHPVRIPDYGRHIQNLVEHCLSLPTRDERTRCARSIIEIMRQVNPAVKEQPNPDLILWEHILKIADYRLDVDVPKGVHKVPPVHPGRASLPYPKNRVTMRQYGYHVEQFIRKVPSLPRTERQTAVTLVANQMKKNYITWVRPDVDNETIYQDISRLSGGKLRLSEQDVILRTAKKLRSELQQCPASDISKRALKKQAEAVKAKAKQTEAKQAPKKAKKGTR